MEVKPIRVVNFQVPPLFAVPAFNTDKYNSYKTGIFSILKLNFIDSASSERKAYCFSV